MKIIKTLVAALALGLSAMTLSAQAEDKGLVGVLDAHQDLAALDQ